MICFTGPHTDLKARCVGLQGKVSGVARNLQVCGWVVGYHKCRVKTGLNSQLAMVLSSHFPKLVVQIELAVVFETEQQL